MCHKLDSVWTFQKYLADSSNTWPIFALKQTRKRVIGISRITTHHSILHKGEQAKAHNFGRNMLYLMMPLILILLNFSMIFPFFYQFQFYRLQSLYMMFWTPSFAGFIYIRVIDKCFPSGGLEKWNKIRNLRRYKFQASEINWLYGEILGIIEPWEFHRFTLRSISRRYKLHVDGLRYFLSMYNENSPIL